MRISNLHPKAHMEAAERKAAAAGNLTMK